MKIVVAGSYRKYWNEICKTIKLLEDNGHEVIAPKKEWEPVNCEYGFIKFRGEENKNYWDLENAFLEKIKQAEALVICNPNGYIGGMASSEFGFTCALLACEIGNIKQIYFTEKPIGSYFFDENGNFIKNIEDLILNDEKYSHLKFVYYNLWEVDRFSKGDKEDLFLLKCFVEDSFHAFCFYTFGKFDIDDLITKTRIR